jgi:hypothetical protein
MAEVRRDYRQRRKPKEPPIDPEQDSLAIEQKIDWHSFSDEELEAIQAFAEAAQRRHNAALRADEQLILRESSSDSEIRDATPLSASLRLRGGPLTENGRGLPEVFIGQTLDRTPTRS